MNDDKKILQELRHLTHMIERLDHRIEHLESEVEELVLPPKTAPIVTSAKASVS